MGEGEGCKASSVSNGVGEHVHEGSLVVLVHTSAERFLTGPGQQLAEADLLADGCRQGCENCGGKQTTGQVGETN